jgi:hypothetical protein
MSRYTLSSVSNSELSELLADGFHIVEESTEVDTFDYEDTTVAAELGIDIDGDDWLAQHDTDDIDADEADAWLEEVLGIEVVSDDSDTDTDDDSDATASAIAALIADEELLNERVRAIRKAEQESRKAAKRAAQEAKRAAQAESTLRAKLAKPVLGRKVEGRNDASSITRAAQAIAVDGTFVKTANGWTAEGRTWTLFLTNSGVVAMASRKAKPATTPVGNRTPQGTPARKRRRGTRRAAA